MFLVDNFTKIFLILPLLLCITCKREEKKKYKKPEEGIKNFEIIPKEPSGTEKLRVRIQGLKGENFDVKWYVNGEFKKGGKFLLPEYFKKGDKVFAELIVNGKKFYSDTVTVKNSKPYIKNAEFEGKKVFSKQKKIKVNIEGADDDGDELEYICEWRINGEEYAKNGNEIEVNLKTGDMIEVFIYAFDGEDTSETPFILRTFVLNSPPEIKIKPGEKLTAKNGVINFKIPAYDYDGDPLKFKLKKAPPGITIDSIQGIINGKLEKEGNYVIEFEVSDTAGNNVTYRLNFSFTK